MANEMITQLPSAANSNLSDIIYAVQGFVSTSAPGTSVQATIQQVLSLLTAGTNISISPTFVISATGLEGIGWVSVTATTQAMVADTGYVANNSSLVTLTLPTTAAFGTIIYVQGLGAGGWLIAQNASQQIILGSSASTAGTGGHIASSNKNDSIALLCVTANLTWTALGAPQGNITVV